MRKKNDSLHNLKLMITCYAFIVTNVYMYFEYLFMYTRGTHTIDKMSLSRAGCNYYEKFASTKFSLVFKPMFNQLF